MLEWRKLVCGVMIAVTPAPLLAQYSERAMLRADGGTWLNESPAPVVSAIFPDSLVQTQAEHTARIEAEGSTVLIAPETVVQYQGNELALDHGSLQLDTARQMTVIIGCITVTPISSERTQYEVVDVDGKVRISASKNDVKIHLHGATHRSKQSASSDFVVHEGEQKTRSEHCGGALLPQESADKSILDSTWAKWTPPVTIGLICIKICTGGDGPISPSKP